MEQLAESGVTIVGLELKSGFLAGALRDTTRIAGSDVAMMTDILLTNRQ